MTGFGEKLVTKFLMRMTDGAEEDPHVEIVADCAAECTRGREGKGREGKQAVTDLK